MDDTAAAMALGLLRERLVTFPPPSPPRENWTYSESERFTFAELLLEQAYMGSDGVIRIGGRPATDEEIRRLNFMGFNPSCHHGVPMAYECAQCIAAAGTLAPDEGGNYATWIAQHSVPPSRAEDAPDDRPSS